MMRKEETDGREEAALREQRAETAVTQFYSGIDWISILGRLLKKIHWILLAAALGALAAWMYTSWMVTPVYQATSKIYIAGSDSKLSLSDLQLGSSLTTDYEEVFRIWHVHEMVDERLNLDYSYPKLSGMVSVYNPGGSHLLYIHVRSADAEEARLLADTYAEVVQDFISARMELRRPQILQSALTPSEPVSPDRPAAVFAGLLAGGLGMALVLVFIFLLDDRIRGSEDIAAAADLPVFGTITRQDMARNAAEQTEQPPAAAPGEHQAVFRGCYSLDYAGTEAVNTICSGMVFAGRNVKRILITSCGANEGKSFVALQTAIGMTRRGKKVLLIDADLRLSVMRSSYDISLGGRQTGLAHLLSGQCTTDEAVYETSIPGMYLIPDGESVRTPLSLLTSAEFGRLMETAGEQFDMVIVDTPPLGTVVDAAEIARHCDGCMLVVRYDHTRAKPLKEAVRKLKQTGTPVLGCIVNRANAGLAGRSPYYGGQYGYSRQGKGERKDIRSLIIKIARGNRDR